MAQLRGLRKTKESKEERDQWDPLFGAVDPRPSREKAGFCRVVAHIEFARESADGRKIKPPHSGLATTPNGY